MGAHRAVGPQRRLEPRKFGRPHRIEEHVNDNFDRYFA